MGEIRTEKMALSEGGGDETAPSSSSSSPRNKVKFLCSHGGKILPRPTDGQLKYVGGETRVIAIPRDINFAELMKKLSTVYDGDMILKYQLISEDLDALVSVRNDEDLRHMLEEYDRHESEGTVKFRAFLFPSDPLVMENQPLPVDPQAVEQRYIDAINGLVRSSSCNGRLTPINARYASFSISSACSSPKSTSPDSKAVNSVPNDILAMNGGFTGGRSSMHKVQSSPSICSLSTLPPQSTSTSPCNHHFYQHTPPPYHHTNHHQLHHPHSYQIPVPSEIARGPIGHSPTHYYATSRNHLGVVCYNNKYRYYDEPASRRLDRAESLPQSLPPSPKISSFEDMKAFR